MQGMFVGNGLSGDHNHVMAGNGESDFMCLRTLLLVNFLPIWEEPQFKN